MVIKFQDQEPTSASGANQESAAVPSNFTSLGSEVQAVVMRLSPKLPRIKVASPPQRSGGRTEKGSQG